MPTKVLQVDLDQPLSPIETSEDYPGLWILVRVGIRPLGWVKTRRSVVGAVITPPMLRELIAEQLGSAVLDAFRNRTYAAPSEDVKLPSMSVVVCTREHPDLLERQMKSLMLLTHPDYEVIVVDNAPKTNGTRKVCDLFPHVRYILEARKGLDYARNAGWQAARNEIICYTDDDAAVDPRWLTALAHNYLDPKVTCVTGITFPMELETLAQEYFERYGGMQRGFVRRVYRPGTWNLFYPLGSGRFGAGVNLTLRRATLESMGGFDNALDVGSIARGGGDLDIMARAIRDGGTLVYEPCAIVWHQHRQTMAQLRKQMFDYGWGFCAYIMKYTSDLELGNQTFKMLRRWARTWGKKRLKYNVKQALRLREHFPVHLILSEILGGILGMPAYGRSLRRVQSLKRQELSDQREAA